MVVAVFGAVGELLKEHLDEETYHHGGGNLEMEIGGDKAVFPFAEEHVRHQVDKAGSHQECPAKDIDVVERFGREPFAGGEQGNPNEYADNDERVGEDNEEIHGERVNA